MKLTRRSFLQHGITGAATVAVWRELPILAAVPPGPGAFNSDSNIIPAPANPAGWPAFREQLVAWREQTKRRLNYNDALYRKAEFAWAASSFACCFLMMGDETFYDPRSA